MNDLSSLKIDKSPTTAQRPQSSETSPLLKWGIIAAIVIVVIIGFFFLKDTLKAPVAVKTIRVEMSNARSAQTGTLTASGYIVPQRKASIASKATGRLVWLGVKEGDKVKQGDLIARIEDADVSARLLQTKSALLALRARQIQEEAEAELAKSELERNQKIFAEGGISASQFDQAKNRYRVAAAKAEAAKADVEAAEASMQAAEVELQNTRIVAPFSGTILTKGADIGEVVSPISGSVQSRGFVVSLADMTTLEAETDVSESNIAKVKVGLPCLITLDAYPQVQYEGTVSAIVPTANRSKATILTKVKFKQLDERVLPEMSAKVLFLEEKKEIASDTTAALAIPLDAITTVEGKKVVFIVEEGKARKVEIGTGRLMGEKVEVKSGITAGQRLVLNPPKVLSDGDKVSE
ncbi:MAG: efflux RND transporter periplasmic adaptor subunit [Chloroherpetonaceae bacterium]|nr:efflux RND transporter periplasmic adaptor subunit [Chloroherpetonaceae bacterium]